MADKSLTLSAEQVRATIEASRLSHQQFAERVGCGASQMWKYQQEGLPPRMNRLVRANILQAAAEAGVLPHNARTRASVEKLAKGNTQTGHRSASHQSVLHQAEEP